MIRLHYGKQVREWWEEWKQKPKRKRHLHPRTPEDCPFCQAYEPACPMRSSPVRPWREVKSRAGRPKTYDSEGYWCDNPACEYYGITEAGIHALVSDGWRGKAERIRRWRCAACGNRFSARRHTPLYRLKTPSRRVAEVLTAMAEGVDTAAGSRIFNHHPKTITHWVQRGGQHGQRLHEHFFRQIRSGHFQVDELVTKVRHHPERVWIWTGIDAETKVLLALHLGRRTREDGHALVHEVKQRLTPEQLPVFSSDGFQQYFYALTAHFGHWSAVPGKRKPVWQVDERLLYGQVHKVRSGYRLKRMYSRIRWGTREAYRAQLQALGFTGKVQTAYVERLNLTLRELVAPLSRRTWSLAQTPDQLACHLEWGRAYYRFSRFHDSLRQPGPSSRRRRSRTPAMAVGVTCCRWPVQRLLQRPMPAF